MTAIIVIGRYCLYVPTKRKAEHGCSIHVGTEEEIKRAGHSTPTVRAISEIGAHKHCFPRSLMFVLDIYMYRCLYN